MDDDGPFRIDMQTTAHRFLLQFGREEETMMKSSISNEEHTLYQQLINAWNDHNAFSMTELCSEEGVMIGGDGI